MLRAAITRLCCSETMSAALRLGVTSAQNVSASGRPTLCQMHPGGHFAQLHAFRSFRAANVCLKSRAVTKAAAAAPVDQMYDSEDDFDDLEQDMAPGVDLGGQPWAQKVHEVTLTVLETPDMVDEFALYSFRAFPSKRVDIRIDKLTNEYGSPSLDDIALVARRLNAEMTLALGEDLAGQIETDVSSPGAERPIAFAQVERFAELPMTVTFRETDESGAQRESSRIFSVELLPGEEPDSDASTAATAAAAAATDAPPAIVWQLADVRGNDPGKGRKMNKKMQAQRWTLSEDQIVKIQLYIEL